MSRKLGNLGEDLACDILKENGYIIIDRNFQIRGGEIDIIAKEKETNVFIEVKCRKDEGFGSAVDYVTKQKVRNILKAAKVYLYEKKLLENDWRIDVVIIDPVSNKYELLKNVYTDGL